MAAEDVLKQFLEESGGHVVMDSDLHILDAGPEFVRLTRTRREDLLGTSFQNILTEPDQKRHIAAIDAVRTAAAIAVKTRQPYRLKVYRSDVVLPDTSQIEERWWDSTITPVVLEGSNEVCYLVMRMEDVTTEERTTRNILILRRLIYVMATLLVGVVVIAAVALSSNLDKTNKVAGQTCDVQKEQIQGTQLLSRIMSDISGIIIHSP